MDLSYSTTCSTNVTLSGIILAVQKKSTIKKY